MEASLRESFAKRGAPVIVLAKVGEFCKGRPTIFRGFYGIFECGVVQMSSPFTHITGGFPHRTFRFSGSFAMAPWHPVANWARTASHDHCAGRHGQRGRAPRSIAMPLAIKGRLDGSGTVPAREALGCTARGPRTGLLRRWPNKYTHDHIYSTCGGSFLLESWKMFGGGAVTHTEFRLCAA